MHFENCWLARYPRPVQVIHDQGPAFTAPPFPSHTDLQWYVPSVNHNQKPASMNTSIEPLKTNYMLSSTTANNPQDIGDAIINVIDSAIASTVFAS
jgi:hypothetical protein